uniref:Uncharacterized protein n=1 Tax=Streptomyces sp. NBC_00003 TaxID=2903608 RepID=A0AAU2VFF7_9ACTN
MPMTDEVFDAVTDGSTGAELGFWRLPGGFDGLLARWSAAGPLAYAEAEYFGGVGEQRAAVWQPERLRAVWAGAGLVDVSTVAIEVATVFTDFADLWEPFLSGQGPAPGYVAALAPSDRERLREALGAAGPRKPDGSIALTARAWAVSGRRGQAT